jgi:hypothetical protein
MLKSATTASNSLAITSNTVMTLTPLNTATVELSTDTLILRIRERQQQIDALKQLIDNDKITLESRFLEGTITDKLSTKNVSATRTTRTSYTYSPAVKQLQEMEVIDGIATPKQSVSWVIRESKA